MGRKSKSKASKEEPSAVDAAESPGDVQKSSSSSITLKEIISGSHSTRGSHRLALDFLGGDTSKFGKAPSYAQTFETENDVQEKIRKLLAQSWRDFELDSWYTLRDRYVHTTSFLQNEFPRRTISLPTMELIGTDVVRRRVEPKVDRWIIEHIKDFREARPEISAKTLLKNFLKESTKFAILSHRWSNDEMSFQDVIKLARINQQGIGSFIREQERDKTQYTSSEAIDKLVELSMGKSRSPQEPPLLSQLTAFLPHIKQCTGLVKLIKFCDLAHNSHKLDLVWIDTCCIDKTSSAELDEAIRSMFRWYRGSAICIIHLAETETKEWPGSLSTPDAWFSRGWTLQELLAPPIVKFYSSSWDECTTVPNDKSDQLLISVIRGPRRSSYYELEGKTMVDWLSEVTKIPANDLVHFEPGLGNLRQRLSWSSTRSTTRVEDMAYCLVGIFNINLSIAYGEGESSFYRFQQAIMERSNDRNIFQWSDTPSESSSMLASEPKCFPPRHYQHIDADTAESPTDSPLDPTFMLTNNGLRITMSLYSKEASLEWLNRRLRDPHYPTRTWDSLKQASPATQQAVRLAVLGYSAGKPVRLILIEQRVHGHLCYLRYPADPEDSYGLLTDKTLAKPELVYIR